MPMLGRMPTELYASLRAANHCYVCALALMNDCTRAYVAAPNADLVEVGLALA